MAVPVQAQLATRRHVFFQVLANLSDDGILTSPVITDAAADTPAAERLNSFSERAMGTEPVEESNVGMTMGLPAQRIGSGTGDSGSGAD
jgi:hypothetical protein